MNIFQPVCLVTDHLADVMAAENWYRRAREAAAAPPPPARCGYVLPLHSPLARWGRWGGVCGRTTNVEVIDEVHYPFGHPSFVWHCTERLRVNEKMNIRSEKVKDSDTQPD